MGWRGKEARRVQALALRSAAKRCGLPKQGGWGSLREDSGFSVVEAVAASCAASGGSAADKEAAAKAWKAFQKTFRRRAPVPLSPSRAAAPLSPSRRRLARGQALAAVKAKSRPKAKVKAKEKAKAKAKARSRAAEEEEEKEKSRARPSRIGSSRIASCHYIHL